MRTNILNEPSLEKDLTTELSKVRETRILSDLDTILYYFYLWAETHRYLRVVPVNGYKCVHIPLNEESPKEKTVTINCNVLYKTRKLFPKKIKKVIFEFEVRNKANIRSSIDELSTQFTTFLVSAFEDFLKFPKDPFSYILTVWESKLKRNCTSEYAMEHENLGNRHVQLCPLRLRCVKITVPCKLL